jgi:hypothetical protein
MTKGFVGLAIYLAFLAGLVGLVGCICKAGAGHVPLSHFDRPYWQKSYYF